jgi:undecaprenyl-diphosphatase
VREDQAETAPRPGIADHPLLHDHPVALRVAGLLWLAGGLLFIALAQPDIADRVQVVDDAIHRAAVAAEWWPFVIGARVLDFVGSVWVTVPVMVVVAIWLIRRRRWEGLVFWVVAMALSQLAVGPIKALYARPRPPVSLVETTSFSFPSGHSVAGAAIVISLVIVLVPAGPKRRNLELIAAAFAVVMALSRVYLRAHWLTDVTAGAALGAAIAILTAVVVHRVAVRRQSDARA